MHYSKQKPSKALKVIKERSIEETEHQRTNRFTKKFEEVKMQNDVKSEFEDNLTMLKGNS